MASNRPRTLVAAIDEREVAAMVIGPWAEPVTPWARADVSENPVEPRPIAAGAALAARRAARRRLRSHQRCHHVLPSVARPAASRCQFAAQRARASSVPAPRSRVTWSRSGRAASPKLRHRARALARRVTIAVDRAFARRDWRHCNSPSFALGAHRFRKGMTYAEYLARRRATLDHARLRRTEQDHRTARQPARSISLSPCSRRASLTLP